MLTVGRCNGYGPEPRFVHARHPNPNVGERVELIAIGSNQVRPNVGTAAHDQRVLINGSDETVSVVRKIGRTIASQEAVPSQGDKLERVGLNVESGH